MPKRKAGRGVVRLECLAHLEEARKIRRERAEACLVRCLAVGHVAADGRDGNAKPVVAKLTGLCGSVGPSAVLLAEVIGDIVHLQHFGREQLRQRVQTPSQIEPRAGVRRDGGFWLHVLEGLAEHVHFGAGGGLECSDHGIEGIVFRRHEAFPAHHGQFGARLRLPRRGICPGLGKVEQSRPGQRAGRSQRGAALKK